MFDYQSPIVAGVVNNLNNEILKLYEDTALVEIKAAIGYNIDKEELIKALAYDRHQYEKGYQDGKAEAERLSGWIPINDRLPEEGENILIFVNDLKSEPVQADVCYYDGDEAWLDSGYNFGSDVTYWMPLPKPPEVNKNDEP